MRYNCSILGWNLLRCKACKCAWGLIRSDIWENIWVFIFNSGILHLDEGRLFFFSRLQSAVLHQCPSVHLFVCSSVTRVNSAKTKQRTEISLIPSDRPESRLSDAVFDTKFKEKHASSGKARFAEYTFGRSAKRFQLAGKFRINCYQVRSRAFKCDQPETCP